MPVHLHETVDVVPGRMREYQQGLDELFAPLGQDRGVIMSGVFEVAGTSGPWPRAVLLWQIGDWPAYARQRTTAGSHPGVGRWHLGALSWRTGGYDRMLSPLPWSPLPPARPAADTAPSICLQQVLLVRAGAAPALAAGVRDSVVGAAAADGVTLRCMWRSSFRPREFVALWSVPSWEALAALQKRRPSGHAASVPGMEAMWPHLASVEERVLIPAPFSPLGGRDAAAAQAVRTPTAVPTP